MPNDTEPTAPPMHVWSVRRVADYRSVAWAAGVSVESLNAALPYDAEVGRVEAETKGAAIMRAYETFRIPPTQLIVKELPHA